MKTRSIPTKVQPPPPPPSLEVVLSSLDCFLISSNVKTPTGSYAADTLIDAIKDHVSAHNITRENAEEED